MHYQLIMATLVMSGGLSLLMPFQAIACKTHNKQAIKQVVAKAALKHNLPVELLEAIVAVESNWCTSAINRHTRDYGLMQINYKNFRHYKLTPETAVDLHKNVEVGAKILATIKKKFGHELHWYCRFNVGWAPKASNWTSCIKYAEKIAKYYVPYKLQVAKGGFNE